MIIQTSLFPLFFFTNVKAITISKKLIIVKTGYKTKPLIAHETCHQKQMEALGSFGSVKFWFKYWFSKSFRQAAEVEAYKISIANGESINLSAMYLSSGYSLGLSFQQAKDLLTL